MILPGEYCMEKMNGCNEKMTIEQWAEQFGFDESEIAIICRARTKISPILNKPHWIASTPNGRTSWIEQFFHNHGEEKSNAFIIIKPDGKTGTKTDNETLEGQ